MGYYSDYLNRNINFDQMSVERKVQITKISKYFSNADVLIYAADLTKNAPTMLDYTDILAFEDQLSGQNSSHLVLVLETPGGFAEIVEDLVRIIRQKYDYLSIIIPGYAKSAGTIFAMSANDIYMGDTSSLGPIDAQIQANGKQYSADELLDKFKDLSKEIEHNGGKLNPAYIPTLSNLSLGELKKCENAQDFSKSLVSKWLYEYKFADWSKHENGSDVTTEERQSRADEIALKLRNNATWLTHGRSIKIQDLENMKLKIINYDLIPELAEPVKRYYALMRMSFDANIYKIVETAETQIYRLIVNNRIPVPQNNQAPYADIDFVCPKCHKAHKIQANLGKQHQLIEKYKVFPKDNLFICDACGTQSNLSDLRRQIEAQTGQKIV